jgi:pimeloyl-ACP methyl ester carboxylesterase
MDGLSGPAPDWIGEAFAHRPEIGAVEVEGARIETRAWGERGRPGLLLVHGAGAHADWWRAIALFFAETYRVAAFSLSGMGGSQWRARYSIDLYAEEAFAVAEALGLFEGPTPPVVVAHSFGSRAALRCASGPRADALRAVVLVDNLISPPGFSGGRRPFDARNTHVYPTEAAILARYRLIPAQPAVIPALLEAVAKASIRQVEGGWTWRFDPHLWDRLDERSTAQDLRQARCPVAAIRGARSALMIPPVTAYFSELAPPGTPVVVVPEAHHHLMLDQPLAFVAALRGLLAGWPAKGPA